MNIFTLELFLFSYLACVEGAKILHFAVFASRSHLVAFDPLLNELARRNHQVLTFTPLESKATHQNVRNVIVKEYDDEDDDVDKMKQELMHSFGKHPLIGYWKYKPFYYLGCEALFSNSEIKELVKKGKQYDVVIVSELINECALPIARLVGKSIIIQTPTALLPWDSSIFVPQPLSYVPNLNLPYTSKMNFFQRLNNVITTVGMRLIADYYFIPSLQKIVDSNLPNAHSIKSVRQQVSLYLTNADPVLISPRPTMPNIINAGGTHCKRAEPLPKDLEDFMQSSGENGVVLFSLGSNIKSKFLSATTIKIILEVIGKLKQKVIWKYEEDLPNIPANLKIVKWMPQQDVLGHSKTRLFITQGGILSLQESLYHGVPVVAIPLFADQPGNVARVEELGIGKKLDYFTISEETFAEAVNSVLNDKSYLENAKKYSAIFRDQYQTPLERAVFWVEYVIRHDGAAHLRSVGEDLNFFQYFLLDIIGFFLAIGLTCFGILYVTCKFVIHKFCICKKEDKKKSKKE